VIQPNRFEPLVELNVLDDPRHGIKRRAFLYRFGAASLAVSAALFGKVTIAQATNRACCNLAWPNNINNAHCYGEWDGVPNRTVNNTYVWYCSDGCHCTCSCCEDYDDNLSGYQCNCFGPLC
jgi:hypothetical protein